MNLKELERLANEGSPWYQWELSNYIDDNSKDYKAMYYWLQKSAAQGFAKAQHDLSILYYKGLGIRKNYTKAFYWMERSANNGCVGAMYRLAIYYYEGKVTKRDYTKAFLLFKKVAKGHSFLSREAKANLGLMYYEGLGTKHNYNKAIYYTKKSNTYIADYNLKIMEDNKSEL